jgi:hypothetical protein
MALARREPPNNGSHRPANNDENEDDNSKESVFQFLQAGSLKLGQSAELLNSIGVLSHDLGKL